MSSYLPQYTKVVCTMQVSPAPGRLLADPKPRTLTVIHSKKDAVLLTNVDLILENDFGCVNSWKGPVSSGWFFAGLAIGLTIAAVVFSVVTLGVGAVIIGACVVAAATYSYAAAKSNSKKCTKLLNEWQNYHATVRFDLKPALIQKSILTCNVGGILKPIISGSLADNMAQSIANANQAQLTLTGVISLIFGTSVGYTLGSTGGTAYLEGSSISSSFGTALFAAGQEVVYGILGAYILYAPLSNLESDGMRGYYRSEDGNSEYDRMDDARNDNNSFVYDSPDDDYNPKDVFRAGGEMYHNSVDMYRYNQNEGFIKEMMEAKGTKAERQAQIERIALEMKKTKSGNIAVGEMRRKRSGKIIIREKTSKKGNKVLDNFKSDSRAARSEVFRGTSANGYTEGLIFNGVVLALPLMITPLDEYTIKIAADYAVEDASNGNSIISKQQ